MGSVQAVLRRSDRHRQHEQRNQHECNHSFVAAHGRHRKQSPAPGRNLLPRREFASRGDLRRPAAEATTGPERTGEPGPHRTLVFARPAFGHRKRRCDAHERKSRGRRCGVVHGRKPESALRGIRLGQWTDDYGLGQPVRHLVRSSRFQHDCRQRGRKSSHRDRRANRGVE